MFCTRLLRLSFRMCRITPEAYESLYKKFSKNPQLQELGKYLTNTNLVQIYNIVKNTHMNPNNKIAVLNEVSEKLCSNNTDQQFNILANIHKDKSLIYLQLANLTEAIVEIQQSLKSIQAMEDPSGVEVASILQIAANLHVKARNFVKAQKFLKDAEHLISLSEQQILESTQIPKEVKQKQLEFINSVMASIMCQFCLTLMSQRRSYEARQYLAKSLQRWKNVLNKNNTGYLLANQCKCLLHLQAKQQRLAVQSAKQYLENYPPTQETVGPRMWFMKFLIDKGVDTYTQQLKQNIEHLSKEMGEQQLADFLRKMGVIRKPWEDSQVSKNTPNNKNTA